MKGVLGPYFSSANFELISGHSKYSLNIFWIPNAYLDVGLLVKPGSLVDRLSFQKNASDGIEFRQVRSFIHIMDVIYDCAIQVTKEQVPATLVLWHLGIEFLNKINEVLVAALNKFDAF
jgi:hypothetical protein